MWNLRTPPAPGKMTAWEGGKCGGSMLFRGVTGEGDCGKEQGGGPSFF